MILSYDLWPTDVNLLDISQLTRNLCWLSKCTTNAYVVINLLYIVCVHIDKNETAGFFFKLFVHICIAVGDPIVKRDYDPWNWFSKTKIWISIDIFRWNFCVHFEARGSCS